MFKHNFRFAILCGCLLYSSFSNAQLFDSLQAKVGLESRFSSANYQPLWLIANHFGAVADRQNDLSSYIRLSNKNVIAQREYTNDHGFYDYNDLTLSYGLSIYNNNHFHSTIIEEGYGKLEYKNWSLSVGRFEEITGDIDRDLSTGSLGVSGNALPIPKIEIAVTDYKNIPFTNGWLQFKGTLAHGWLGNNRYIKNAYYHQKTFYLRIGPGRLKFYGGIQHFAEWGGNRGDLQLDKSFKDFLDVLFAKEADGPLGNGHAGDQRGVLEGGICWENDLVKLQGYLQKPFEGKNDIGLKTKNVLAGFVITIKDEEIHLQKILLEVISTKNINENIPPSQRESYYNNNTYKTGWEYENSIIGTPLFINRVRGSDYFQEIQPFDWDSPGVEIPGNGNIINNRVFGIHLGALYSINQVIQGKTLLTYTENYGSPNYANLFAPGKNRFYGLQQISYEIVNKNLTITAGVGFDYGELSKTNIAGGLLGIEWNITGHKNANDY